MVTSNMKLIGASLIKLYAVYKLFHHIFFFDYLQNRLAGFFHSRSSMDVSNMNLIRALVSQLRETQALACGGCGGGGSGCDVQTKTIISPKFQISVI